jgi:signal transduction histidine kinase
MTTPLNLLLVDDSEDDAAMVVRALRTAGREVVAERVDSAAALKASLLERQWDVVISDWSIPGFGGHAALELVRSMNVDVPFIIVSGTVTEEMAVKAMRSGARDWLPKDKLGRLAPAVERELQEATERRRNVEALRRTEEQLRQSQKLEAIGGLAAGIAHDFNNMLSVIIAHADLMRLDVKDDGPMTESLDEIRSAAGRAAEMTRQLLAFSRQQVLQPRVVPLIEAVRGIEKMLRRLIGEDIDLAILDTSRDTSDGGRVLVDPGQLGQVILNLAVNARDAMPDGGSLTIETMNVDLDEDHAAAHLGTKPGPHVLLAVSDTGTGMDAATQARIFEPFFTTKEVGKGTGLGLATALGIIQQSGGTMWVYSEVGHGTTFKIYLPRVSSPAEPGHAEAESRPLDEAASRGTESVLLVEDDAAVRAVIRTVLVRQGYRVSDVANGEEALAWIAQNPGGVDLLLVDVVMPRMGGRELAERVRAEHPSLPLIFMSGYTGGALVRLGVLEPGLTFLQKPISPSALIRAVREVLDRASARAS